MSWRGVFSAAALAFAVLAAPGEALAADWFRVVTGTNGDAFDLDAGSISRRGDLAQSYMRQTLAQPQRDQTSGKAFTIAIVARFDDCAGRRYAFGEFVRRDRNDVNVATGKSSGEWHDAIPGSVAESLWRMACAVTTPPKEEAYVADLSDDAWQSLGLAPDKSYELAIRGGEIVRLDDHTIIVLSRSTLPQTKMFGDVPARYTVAANLVDCKALKAAVVGGDFYLTPQMRVRAVRQQPSEVRLETISPNSFLYSSLKTVCAPNVGTPLKADVSSGYEIGTAWGVEKGYLVTASHVVTGSGAIAVYRNGELMGRAVVVANDQANDLAVLSVKLKAPHKLMVLPLASRSATLGRRVFTLGYPEPDVLGQRVKMTAGEVSSTAGAGDDARFLQVSIPLQPGNSGGPVIDSTGVVVGVAEAVLKRFSEDEDEPKPQMVNYAVKISYLRPLLDDLPARGPYTIVRATGTPEAIVAATQPAVYMVVVKQGGE